MLRLVFDYPAEGEDFWVDNVSVTQYMPAVSNAGGWVVFVCLCLFVFVRVYIHAYVYISV